MLLGLAGAVAPGAGVRAEVHVAIVTGLGGEAYYAERFESWSRTLLDVARERLGVADERLVWLAPAGVEGAHGESRLEGVRETLATIAARSRPGDVLLLALIGHGTAQPHGDARFNLPGPDLDVATLGELLAPLHGRDVVVANTSTASAPFVEGLSAPGRIIITATASARENEFARFGGFFAEAFAAEAADADKNGRVSVFEAFEYARAAVGASYAEERLMQTEHALLDDNGDGRGTLEPGGDGVDGAAGDGALARSVYLQDEARPADMDDALRLALGIEARQLVERVASLRRQRHLLTQGDYDRQLESLLVELAENRRAWRGEVGP